MVLKMLLRCGDAKFYQEDLVKSSMQPLFSHNCRVIYSEIITLGTQNFYSPPPHPPGEHNANVRSLGNGKLRVAQRLYWLTMRTGGRRRPPFGSSPGNTRCTLSIPFRYRSKISSDCPLQHATISQAMHQLASHAFFHQQSIVRTRCGE
jgi:hypothetical protein